MSLTDLRMWGECRSSRTDDCCAPGHGEETGRRGQEEAWKCNHVWVCGNKKQSWNVLTATSSFLGDGKTTVTERKIHKIGGKIYLYIANFSLLNACTWHPTWVEVPLVVLWRRHQRHQDCEHSDRKQPQAWQGHDSSNAPGYLSGDTPMTTGIPVVEKEIFRSTSTIAPQIILFSRPHIHYANSSGLRLVSSQAHHLHR